MHEVLVNRLEGLSLPRKSVVRLTDRPDMTLDVYRGRKTTKQQSNVKISNVKYLKFAKCFLLKKMREAFAVQKLLSFFFNKKFQCIWL